ncbi:MAG: MlaE family ABC transporter permease [Desulfobacteraceae bacterium]
MLAEPLARMWVNLGHRLDLVLGIFALFYQLLLASFTSRTGFPLLLRESARQVYFTAVQGGFLVGITALILGLLVIVHTSPHLIEIRGEEFIGQLLVIIVLREVGPVLTAFFVLLRSGTAIIVEIGIMAVTRELEALHNMGIDPHRFLGLPRFWGLTVSMIALFILSTITAVLGGFVFAQLFAEIYWQGFWLSLLNALGWLDLMVGLAKVILFGMLIATVSLYYGLQARGQLGTLARHTSRGAVLSLLLCGIVDAFLSSVFYL